MSDTSSHAPQAYRLFGLVLHSELELPELERCDAPTVDAVRIRFGPVLEPADGDGDPRHRLGAAPGGAILSVADVARFHIRDGAEIVVDPDPAASPRNIRLFLLGSAMGALLHQRRILPLHANAIEIGGRAVAFLGHSGAGKSTLAAAFHDRGRRILSDDVCTITRQGDTFIAQPGIPRLRLWRDAVERSGRETDDYERAFDTLDKYTVLTDRTARAAALPLAAIFLLASHAHDGPATIDRLTGTAAIQALLENSYRGSFLAIAGDARTHFEACVALSRAVPLFQLSRPWDPARIDETVALVEAALSAAPA